MSNQRVIEVWADWQGLGERALMGRLSANLSRGKEIFSFEYQATWIDNAHHLQLDPALALYGGPQYPSPDNANFGLFLDSSPDRWGRVLMRRREAQRARAEGRKDRRLHESDYLLGVHDRHRMGGLRFRTNGPFLDDNTEFAAPPWTSLRELQHAASQLERDDSTSHPNYSSWLQMLITPGGSLGGARPKASVLDSNGQLWIAKFPSRRDENNVGAWESVVHELAIRAGLKVARARLEQFGSPHHTFLSRRFDRTSKGRRLHFASAMTLLERRDGDKADDGASYLELADLLMQSGSSVAKDLEELWRRISFFVCVSNTDDHLRNHGYILTNRGWELAPAYDMNPDPNGEGLTLNISESDNAQDSELVVSVAPFFRISNARSREILDEVVVAVRTWREVATRRGISNEEQDRMSRAFRHANN